MDRSAEDKDGIPFDLFANFERIPDGNPLIACDPPEWAAAAHAIVVGETVHYLWGRRRKDNYWALMHSTAPAGDPAAVSKDPVNPIFTGSGPGVGQPRRSARRKSSKGRAIFISCTAGTMAEPGRSGMSRTRDFRSFRAKSPQSHLYASGRARDVGL